MDGLDPGGVVVPKVVVDRYRKRIKSEDINRAQANYAKAATAGALAGLVARFKQMPARHRATAGAAAGILAEGIVRAAGKASKDPYGERSHTAKTSEQIPAAAGLVLAGTLGYRRLKRAAREFEQEETEKTEIFSQSPLLPLLSPVKFFEIPVRLRAKLIAAAALAGGITAADAATRAAFPGDEDRKKAAVKGLKEGALYGSVLAGSEPVLRKIAMKFSRLRNAECGVRNKKQIFEFRALTPNVQRRTSNVEAVDEEDLARQRRRLALYAGGALAGAGALALLARSGRAITPVSAAIKPAGRGTLERLAQANALRNARGYVHLKPMMPGGRKRFDKLPAGTQMKTGKFAGLAVNPNLSSGEKRKFRQAVGKIRAEHKFEWKQKTSNAPATAGKLCPTPNRKFAVANVEFARGDRVKKVLAYLLNPSGREKLRRVIENRGGPQRAMPNLALKMYRRDPYTNPFVAKRAMGLERRLRNAVEFNLTPAKLNAPVQSDDTIRNPFYKKPTLRRAQTFPQFKDLVKPRFKMRTVKIADLSSHQPLLEKEKVEKFTGRKTKGTLPIVHDTGDNWHIHDGNHRLAVLKNIGRKTAKVKVIRIALERKLRNAVEFMYAAGAAQPQNDLPDWVQIRRGNAKRRDRIKTAAEVAGLAGGTATIAGAVHAAITRRKAVKSLKDYLRGVGLGRKLRIVPQARDGIRNVIEFKRREQLREGGKSEAEKGSGRFVDPISVAAGLRPGYSISPGGERRFYGGASGGDLAITHAQVLRSAYHHGGSIRKIAHRAGNLVRDTADVAAGNPRRADAYGRPQRREWEKPWFGRAVRDAALGSAVLGGALALKNSPKLRGHVLAAGAEVRRKVNKMIPDFFADWGPGVKVTEFDIRMGVVKRALRGMLQKSGAPIVRSNNFPMPAYVPRLKNRLQRAIMESAGIKQHSVSMPRFKGLLSDTSFLPKPMQEVAKHPAYAALHESAHALDPKLRAVAGGAQLHPSEHRKLLRNEVTANKIASRHLKQAGASSGELGEWRQRAHKQMSGGYRWPFVTIRAGGIPFSGLATPTISEAKQVLRKDPWLRKKNIGFETNFSSVPFKFGGKIDYARQNAMYEWAKHLRRGVRRKAGLPLRPAIAGSLPAKPSNVVKGFSRRNRSRNMNRNRSRSRSRITNKSKNRIVFGRNLTRAHIPIRVTEFDDIANWAGWDVRDPRGRSARVFAPGSRKRQRREKEWHERIDNQRRLLGALAAIGTVGGIGGGILIGRKAFPKVIRAPSKGSSALWKSHSA